MNNRAQRRAAAKKGKIIPKEKIYNLTESALNDMLQNERMEAYKKASELAGTKYANIAWQLMLAIPCEVLIGDGYWAKTAKKKLPKFIDDCLSLYDSYNAGTLTLAEMRKDIKENAGIELKVDESVKDA